MKAYSFFYIFFVCSNISFTKTTDFSSFLLKTAGAYDCSKSQSHYVSLNPSNMPAVGERKNYVLQLKLYSYSALRHVTQENFVFLSVFCLLAFFSFSFFGLFLTFLAFDILLTKRRTRVFDKSLTVAFAV